MAFISKVNDKYEVSGDTEYQQYFKQKLREFGVEDPADIPMEDRDTFFKEVDKGWKAAKE